MYGLGALFYAMLTGEPPRKDANLSGELKNTLELDHRLRRYREGIANTPKPTAHYHVRGVDRSLATIIDNCLEIDPQKRLSSAEAILHALEKRRMRRRQRPLLIFGGVAPLVFILLMLVVGGFVAAGQIHNARETLIKDIMDNDQAMANLGAWGMQKGFNRRLTVVKEFLTAGGDQSQLVADAAKARKEAASGDPIKEQAWQDYRAKLKRWLNGYATQKKIDDYFYITGITVVGKDGYMLMSIDSKDHWDSSPDFEQNGAKRKWAWRDWFSGKGNQLDENCNDPPVTAPHISQPYRSTDGGEEKLEVTVPIRVAGQADPVGVIVGSMKWVDLSRWLHKLNLENGLVTIFNERGHCLMHGYDNVLKDIKDIHDNPPVYHGLDSKLVGAKTTIRNYIDPVDQDTYLAGYKTFDPYNDAEVGDDEPGAAGRWSVLVQHDKDDVLKPVNALYGQLIVVGVCILFGAGVFTAGVWFGLIWLVRRQERLRHL